MLDCPHRVYVSLTETYPYLVASRLRCDCKCRKSVKISQFRLSGYERIGSALHEESTNTADMLASKANNDLFFTMYRILSVL